MNDKPTIGKDVIESLTLGMYEDCRFIFREYIQNAADQIDKAVREGIINKSEEEIYITINQSSKRIEVFDNATGIKQKEVLPILLNIAQSTKKRGVDKGFRGIGRLGGLGYCSKLTFETSAKGESVKSTMVWDAQMLKDIINNRSVNEDAADVIREVTSLEVSEEDVNAHYFKVILEDVTNSELLNIDSVRDYLSMVSPVDYVNVFIYRSKIYEYMKSIDSIVDKYQIFLNQELIQKPYSSKIFKPGKNGKKEYLDDILDVEFFEEIASDGNLLFWGWYSISSAKAQMAQVNQARGMRLRKANIQLGSEETLSRFFPKGENRWNFYYFGEVHAVHPELIPNARRDYFSENTICREFETKLSAQIYKLYKLTYAASNLNNSNKKIQEALDLEASIIEKQNSKGFQSKEEIAELYKQLEEIKEKAKKSQVDIEKIREKAKEEGLPIDKIYERNTSNKDADLTTSKGLDTSCKPKFITDSEQYSSMPKKDRKLLGKIYSIIGNILPKETSDLVIKKIEEELTK